MRRFLLIFALVSGVALSQGAIAAPVLGGPITTGHPSVTDVYYYRGHYYPYRYHGHYYRHRYNRHGHYYYY